MTAASQAEHYAALYAPASQDLRRLLPDVGDALQAQFHELSARPCLDRCDRLAMSLAGAQTTLRKFREALDREGRGNGQ